MALKAIDYKFDSNITRLPSYSANNLNIGSLIKKYDNESDSTNFIGPLKIGLLRPMESSVPFPVIFPHVIRYSDTLDYCFLADNSAAAPTRRIMMATFNRLTGDFDINGFITLTYPTTTNHTIRGFRMVLNLYTVGTVSVNGTTVSGTNTAWLDSRLSVGSRIGFGSTVSSEITTWYEISAIGSNTSITLTSSVPATIPSGTPYVIEDLMALTTTTNATATNGGLFLAKGLRYELFTNVGVVIPAATTVDRIRAVYRLSDAATLTMTNVAGNGIEDRSSWTSQRVYCINATGIRIFVFNIREALTLTAGSATNALVLQTGNQAITGTISQNNNGRVATLNHGPGSGVPSLYIATTTRIVRCAISAITANSTNFQSDVMIEVPPGGTATYGATSAMASVEYAGSIDRLIINTTGANGSRSYITRYNTISQAFDHLFLIDTKQIDQSSADSSISPHPSILASPFTAWAEEGMLYLSRIGTTALVNHVYAMSLDTDETYSDNTNQVIITPKFTLDGVRKLNTFSVRNVRRINPETFSLQLEPYSVFYRTSGIDTNTGSWTRISALGDMSGIETDTIQFKFTFKTIGDTCIPARILGFVLTYEDGSTDEHYLPSLNLSSISGNTFAYKQVLSWGGNIPSLKITIYNAETNILILEDSTNLQNFGVFEYSINNGTSWASWSSAANSVGNSIRYRANSLPDNIRIKVILTRL